MKYYLISIMTMLFISGLNIVCFFIGAKVGQKVVRDEKIELPNPIKTIKQDIKSYEENKEAKRVQEKWDIIDYNIDVYDGTSLGQKEIPR